MKFTNPEKSKKPIAIVLPILAILLFFFIKVIQFQLNKESFSDGMLALQLSRGWLEGRPLLFDTFYGDHRLIHNYYFILLLGFFTKPVGIYGLFIGYLLLLAIFFWQWNDVSKKFPATSTASWYAVFIFAFGPFALFVYLDFYGWHPEQYLLPLLALFALSLAKRQVTWSIVWFLLAFLVKESSAILLCSILLFCSVTDLTLQRPGKRPVEYLTNKRNVIIVSACFALFILSMWWLSHLNTGQESRLTAAVARFSERGTTKNLLLYSALYCVTGLAIFLIGTVPMLPFLEKIKNGKVVFTILVVGYLVIFAAFFTESLYYFPSVKLAISYPPRAGGLWAFLLGAYVFLSYRFLVKNPSATLNQKPWIFTGLIFQLITAPLLIAHSYGVLPNTQRFISISSYLSKSSFGLNPYPEGTPKQLYQLAQKLPEGTEVVAPKQYINYFENVYPSEWPTEGKKLHLSGKPLIYIYEKQRINDYKFYAFPGSGYVTIPHTQLLILADSLWYNQNFK